MGKRWISRMEQGCQLSLDCERNKAARAMQVTRFCAKEYSPVPHDIVRCSLSIVCVYSVCVYTYLRVCKLGSR